MSYMYNGAQLSINKGPTFVSRIDICVGRHLLKSKKHNRISNFFYEVQQNIGHMCMRIQPIVPACTGWQDGKRSIPPALVKTYY